MIDPLFGIPVLPTESQLAEMLGMASEIAEGQDRSCSNLRELLREQKPLEDEFQDVLDENLFELYGS